jgi:hypothetical protein
MVLENLRNRAKSVYLSVHSRVMGSSGSDSDEDSTAPDDLDVLVSHDSGIILRPPLSEPSFGEVVAASSGNTEGGARVDYYDDGVDQVTVAEPVRWRGFPLLDGEVDPGRSAQSLGGDLDQNVSFHLPPPLAPSHFRDSSQATYFSYPTHMEPGGRQPYPSIAHSGNEAEYLQYHPLPPHQYASAVSGQDVIASTPSTGVALNQVEIWKEFLRQLDLQLSF